MQQKILFSWLQVWASATQLYDSLIIVLTLQESLFLIINKYVHQCMKCEVKTHLNVLDACLKYLAVLVFEKDHY